MGPKGPRSGPGGHCRPCTGDRSAILMPPRRPTTKKLRRHHEDHPATPDPHQAEEHRCGCCVPRHRTPRGGCLAAAGHQTGNAQRPTPAAAKRRRGRRALVARVAPARPRGGETGARRGGRREDRGADAVEEGPGGGDAGGTLGTGVQERGGSGGLTNVSYCIIIIDRSYNTWKQLHGETMFISL
jgi:hypothetical protein